MTAVANLPSPGLGMQTSTLPDVVTASARSGWCNRTCGRWSPRCARCPRGRRHLTTSCSKTQWARAWPPLQYASCLDSSDHAGAGRAVLPVWTLFCRQSAQEIVPPPARKALAASLFSLRRTPCWRTLTRDAPHAALIDGNGGDRCGGSAL